MTGEFGDSPIDDLIGRILGEHSGEILDSYEDSLVRAGGAFTTESPPAQVRAQAAAVLDEVQRRLRDPDANQPRYADELNVAFGQAFAKQALHPNQSLRAADLLCGAILSGIVSQLPPHRDLGDGLVRVAVTTHTVIMEGLTEAAVSYMSYLLERLHRSHADERRRVARELHDVVAHSVVLALQNLELFAMYRGSDTQRAAAKLDAAFRELHEAAGTIRAMTQDLRRSGAEEGLRAALWSYVDSRHHGGPIDICFCGDETYIPDAIRGELFLVLREGLRNAGTHANAKSIRVDVEITTRQVRASVVDDGVGFDVTAEEGGTGLASMRERVSLLGGTIRVSSSPGHGTAVTIDVPLVGAGDD